MWMARRMTDRHDKANSIRLSRFCEGALKRKDPYDHINKAKGINTTSKYSYSGVSGTLVKDGCVFFFSNPLMYRSVHGWISLP